MTKAPLRVICDAGPIIHPDELDCLDLLNDFKEIILPATVKIEIKRNRKFALENIVRKFIELPGKKPRNEQLLTMCQVFSLDIGEIEALAVIEKYPDAMFLTDDEKALGAGIKKPSPSELKNKPVARKSIVAAKNIRKGEAFTVENLTIKRPGTGISPMRWDDILKMKTSRTFYEDEIICL